MIPEVHHWEALTEVVAGPEVVLVDPEVLGSLVPLLAPLKAVEPILVTCASKSRTCFHVCIIRLEYKAGHGTGIRAMSMDPTNFLSKNTGY